MLNIGKIYCNPVTFGGSTKEGRYPDFKNSIKSKLLVFNKKITKEVSLDLKIYIHDQRIKRNRNDLDNFLKPIIDAINEGNVIESETQIKSICIKRVLVDNKQEQGVGIKIT